MSVDAGAVAELQADAPAGAPAWVESTTNAPAAAAPTPAAAPGATTQPELTNGEAEPTLFRSKTRLGFRRSKDSGDASKGKSAPSPELSTPDASVLRKRSVWGTRKRISDDPHERPPEPDGLRFECEIALEGTHPRNVEITIDVTNQYTISWTQRIRSSRWSNLRNMFSTERMSVEARVRRWLANSTGETTLDPKVSEELGLFLSIDEWGDAHEEATEAMREVRSLLYRFGKRMSPDQVSARWRAAAEAEAKEDEQAERWRTKVMMAKADKS